MIHKARGFTLTELLMSLVIASSVSLAGLQWFQMTTSTVMAQKALMEGNEAGRFLIRYLSDQVQRAGLGVQEGLEVDQQDISELIRVRYASISPDGERLFNCLGNAPKVEFFEDEHSVQLYEQGGFELKCKSGRSADWISESLHSMKFWLGVDQGRFINNQFVFGEFDRKIDAYITSSDLNTATMNVLSVKIFLTTYRPSELSMFSRVFWSQKIQRSESDVSREFQTTVFLPNT